MTANQSNLKIKKTISFVFFSSPQVNENVKSWGLGWCRQKRQLHMHLGKIIISTFVWEQETLEGKRRWRLDLGQLVQNDFVEGLRALQALYNIYIEVKSSVNTVLGAKVQEVSQNPISVILHFVMTLSGTVTGVSGWTPDLGAVWHKPATFWTRWGRTGTEGLSLARQKHSHSSILVFFILYIMELGLFYGYLIIFF